MGTSLLGAFFGAIVLYGLSWGSALAHLRSSTNALLLPLLSGYALFLSFVAFLLNTSLLSPHLSVSTAVDFVAQGWDAIEMGVFGALVVASLPFFMLSQTRPITVAGPTTLAGFVSLSTGLVFICTDSLWLMFVTFEFLLLSALYMLLLTSKSERVRDAALEMFL
jgi:hypothetical protein